MQQYSRMARVFFICLFLITSLFVYGPAQAATPGDIIINEIAWMGTESSTADEWIELLNTTDSDIDLTDWTLTWDGGDIALSGTIAAESYFLLERTDDTSVPDFTADQIYTGSLGNAGESLVLRDTDNIIIDEAVFADGWTAGDSATKQTMERLCDTAEWNTSSTVGGTPHARNSVCSVQPPSPEPEPDPTPDPNPDPDPIPEPEPQPGPVQCNLTEISRSCVGDGQAEVVYQYSDQSCGNQETRLENDNACTCLYSNWQNGACTETEQRMQHRENMTSYSYCQATSRLVDDAQCRIDESKTVIPGTACVFNTHRRMCDSNAELIIDAVAQTITAVSPRANQQAIFTIVSKKSFGPLATYKLSYNGYKGTLILNERSGQAFGITHHAYFKGKM